MRREPRRRDPAQIWSTLLAIVLATLFIALVSRP